MADNGISLTPMTVVTWPPYPVRVPRVWTGPVETTDEMLFVNNDPEVVREVEIPAGVYLRELVELDLDSPSAIGSFVEDFGNPGGGLWRTGPTWSELQGSWEATLRSAGIGQEEVSAPSDLPKVPDDEWARQTLAHPKKVPYEIGEFAERARLLRDLTCVHRFLRDDLTFDELRAGWQSRCWPAPEGDSLATAVLLVTLNWSLSAFQPLLEVVLPQAREVTPAPRFEDALRGYQPRLFEVLSLQLFNDIAAHAEYRRCRSETCGRWFTVVPKGQRLPGGFDGAMRSSDAAMYCTPQCARAQAQREHRRRVVKKKAANNRPKGAA
jgi:hypothetical protein